MWVAYLSFILAVWILTESNLLSAKCTVRIIKSINTKTVNFNWTEELCFLTS